MKNTNLSPTFNDVSRQPARMFEIQTGVVGIAGNYRFPGGVSATYFEDMYTWRFFPLQLPGALAHMQDNLQDLEKADLQTAVNHPAFIPVLQKAWGGLLLLNPALKEAGINQETPVEIYHGLLGVTSGFNIDDIKLFNELMRSGGKPYVHSRQQPEYQALIEKIEAVAPRIQWAASLPTLKNIKAQLESSTDPAYRFQPPHVSL